MSVLCLGPMRGHRHALEVVVLLLWASAWAVPARAQWTVAAYLGAAHTSSSTLTLIQPALGTNLALERVDYHTDPLAQPPYYGYRFGYYFRSLPWFGIEAELIHLKVFTDADQMVRMSGELRGVPVDRQAPMSEAIQHFSATHGMNFIFVNAVARRPLAQDASGRSRLTLTARIGLGPTVPHGESTVDGVSQQQYELGRPGVQAAAGLEVRIWRGLHGLGEYKFTDTRQKISVDQGEIQARFLTNHIVFGLAYHF